MLNEIPKSRVIVGLSGGVDSTVAALLLQQAGHSVEALFMKNWDEDDTAENCPAEEDLADAQAVCEALGIHLHKINFSSEYWDRVFKYFLEEYRSGRTPNPDVMCNKEIKFRAFLDYAIDLGADFIATGHYARIERNNNAVKLLKGTDSGKDQTYFLHTLNQYQLTKSLFPIGYLQKHEVRKIAADAGFSNHAKKDSTGICFIGERKFNNFLSQYLPATPGEIRNPEGKVIGTHQGLMFHTLGQRQGLKIGGRQDSDGSPWYVADKDIANNRLIVVQGKNHPLLFKQGLWVDDLSWISGTAPDVPLTCTARIRYRQTDQNCTLKVENDQWLVLFDAPQRAITPGQAVVFYQGEECLGGGIIQTAIRDNECTS